MVSSDKFEYYMDRTQRDIEKINQKLDALWDFKMKLLGMSAIVSVLFSLAVSGLIYAGSMK